MEPLMERLLSSHKDELITLESGRIQAVLTKHEMPPRADVVSAYLASAKYVRVKGKSAYDYDKHLPHIAPHKADGNLLFCKLTRRVINRRPDEVERHVNGKRFKRLLAKLESGDGDTKNVSDEELWVPEEFVEVERRSKRRELACIGMEDEMEDDVGSGTDGADALSDGDSDAGSAADGDDTPDGDGAAAASEEDEDIYPADGPLRPPRKRKGRDDDAIASDDDSDAIEESGDDSGSGDEVEGEMDLGGGKHSDDSGDSEESADSDDSGAPKKKGKRNSSGVQRTGKGTRGVRGARGTSGDSRGGSSGRGFSPRGGNGGNRGRGGSQRSGSGGGADAPPAKRRNTGPDQSGRGRRRDA